jgi:hypothetical protein
MTYSTSQGRKRVKGAVRQELLARTEELRDSRLAAHIESRGEKSKCHIGR